MAENDNKKTTIYVTGDIAMDHFLITGDRKYYDSAEKNGATAIIRKGGAHLLCDFLSTFKKSEGSAIGDVHFGFEDAIFEDLPKKFNSYLKISQFKYEKEKKWKVSEMFGFGNFTGNFNYPAKLVNKNDSDMLLIDDAASDFGSFTNTKAWPTFIQNRRIKKTKLIVYKMTGQIGKGELWKNTLTYFADKLITIVSINDLRKQLVKVSKGISWEQTALDLIYELHNNSIGQNLLKSRFLIVAFQSGGAILIERNSKGNYTYQLIFDPKSMENEAEAKLNGTVVGKLSCFTAMLSAKLNLAKPNKNFMIEDAIKAALSAVRKFNETGYIYDKNDDLNIPFEEMLSVYKQDPYEYTQAFIPSPINTDNYLDLKWSVLLNNYNKDNDLKPLYNIARRVTKYGKSELGNVPHASFGDLYSVDRNEIENFRNVKNIMESYIEHDKGKKPLSIGVFGPPGSGKSFSVEQIAVAVLGKDVAFFEFNLSQFAGPEDLIGAFHQVRDVALKGKVPVVFWDEFDSKNFDWLQYLLAPMQDGKFQEGQISHPIGKSIFIFAGGTSYTMENFGPVEPLNPAEHQSELNKEEKKQINSEFFDKIVKQYEEDVINFKLKKGPDFKSRLNAYLDVLGPNKREYFDRLRWKWQEDENDVFFPLRRALFVRALLKFFDDKELNMEWGLINSFMKVNKFIHGARSLGQIIDQLKNNNRGRIITRSCLPSNNILSLHVDPVNFFEILNENTDFLSSAYDIAPDIHGVWMSTAKTRHHAYIKDFNFLPIFIKESNYAAAKRIPLVLAEVGLIVVDGENPSKIKTKKNYLKLLNEPGKGKIKLEIMAEKEHELWMQFYDDNSWKYNKDRDDSKKQHPCIRKFSLLREEDKQKDRDQVEKYFDFLSTAEFGIAVER